MFTFIGLIVVFLIIFYKRSTEIITINPMSGHRAAPVLRDPVASDEPETIDFARLLNTVQQAAQNNPSGAPKQGREAIRRLVQANQFIEAIQLYRRVYGVDLKTAKQAVDQLMLEQ